MPLLKCILFPLYNQKYKTFQALIKVSYTSPPLQDYELYTLAADIWSGRARCVDSV